jgi:sialate O-acetylesterase
MLFFLQLKPAKAQLQLPDIFGNGMVMQRNVPLRIWGWAKPGDPVSVKLANQKAVTTKAAADGTWEVSLPAMEAGGPHVLSVTSGQTIELKDVLIGEVWIASGQSNMEWRMEDLGPAYKKDIETAQNPQIRMIKVEKQPAIVPLDHFQTKGWKAANPQNVKDFTAVGWYFARQLYDKLKVPIGIINNNWGGTPAEVWVSPEGLQSFPHYTQQLEVIRRKGYGDYKDYRNGKNAEKKARMDSLLKHSEPQFYYTTDELKSAKAGAFLPGMKVARLWEQQQLPDFDGVVFMRKKVTIPVHFDKSKLRLHLGKLDDSDSTFVDGKFVGNTLAHNQNRQYSLFPLSSQEMQILVRVEDNGGGGGFWGSADSVYLEDGKNRLSLADDWEYLPGIDLRKYDVKPIGVWDWPINPSALYFGQLHPLKKFPFRGAIWYQGESNVGRAKEYEKLFPAMIQDWRKQFANPAMPFLFVQLANYLDPQTGPEESSWAELRDAQYKTLSVPHTGMATAIDLGEANDIHPKRKREVGERLSFLALRDVYGFGKIEAEGPRLLKAKLEGNEVHLEFSHADGLRTRNGGPAESFYVCGPDNVWQKASVRIVKNKLILTAGQIVKPVAVRYAWADNPDKANMVNASDLPMIPFDVQLKP